MGRRAILVTGATGFVGSALCRSLLDAGVFDVHAALRSSSAALVAGVEPFTVGELSSETAWGAALTGVDVVIHAAARVHVMNETADNSLDEFRRVNVQGTLNLARQAAAAGVSRFIFISSIKVNGEFSRPGQALTADDVPAPLDPYGVSKYEAEQGLFELASATGMQVVVIRPVLVYGPGVKANFHSMMRWVRRGLPLPLGAIDNRRSLVALDNLLDLIVTCIDHQRAANQIFLVSDGEDVSLTQLLRALGRALGRPARLIPVPATMLRLAAVMFRRRDLAQRLLGSLQVDITKNRQLLGWTPPVTLSQGLEKAARSLLDDHR